LKEAIKNIVVNPEDGHEIELEILYEADVLDFNLNGKKLFSGDYSGNFKKVFKRALEIWGEPDES